MIKRTYSDMNLARLEKRLSEAQEYLSDFDPFENWKAERAPEGMADMDLEQGIYLLSARYSGHMVKQLFERSLSIVERALKDKKYASKKAEFWYPGNRARTWRTYAFAKAFLGSALDLQVLKEAATDFGDFGAKMDRLEWSEMGPENHHEAVRLALIAHDITYARKLMASKRNFGSALQEHRLWIKLLKALDGATLPLEDVKLLNRLDALFDRLRHPHKPVIPALEIGMIRYQYFESGGPIDLSKVIEALGA